MVTGLNHINISTSRLEESIAFFEQVLGLRTGPRPPFSFDGAWLYAGDQPVVHLVAGEGAPAATGALDHVAFSVPDFEAALARLSRLGVAHRWSDIPGGFGRQCFFSDPNGVKIELTGPAA